MGLWLKNVKPVGFRGIGNLLGVAISDEGTVGDTPSPGDEVLDGGGLFMSPGWADLHVHVWYGGTDFSVPADRAGLESGVTAMADAGSAGEATLHGFREYVIERQAETIRAFINIGSIGLVASNRVPELIDERFIDVDRTRAAIEANRDIVCGVKVRASGSIVGEWGITPVRIAKGVADSARLPLMVHVGEPPPDLEEIFALLSPGDIVTHCFNGTTGGAITRDPAIFEQARRLADSGIFMDVGHGAASYDSEVASMSIAEGLVPFSVSTDLHARNVDGPVFDLATTVSKLHAAGLGFEECVSAVSVNPRRVLGLSGADGLTLGKRADFTLFALADRRKQVIDSGGRILSLRKVFEPRFAILGNCLTRVCPGSARQRKPQR